jgi:hypothetical protein
MYGTYDEFGRSKNPDKEIDDILPRLADYDGDLDIITTPDIENEEAIAYIIDKKDKIELGELNWTLVEGSSSENEYLNSAAMESRTQGMSEDKKNQILHGGLSLKGASYFETDNVVGIFSNECKQVLHGVIGHTYWIGLDTAGSGKDYWALNVIDTTTEPWQRVFYYYDKLNQPMFNLGYTKTVIERYLKAGKENVNFVIDKTNEAGAIYFGEFSDYSPVGYRFGTERGTGKSTKAELLDTCRRAINDKIVICTEDRMLRNQIVSYKGPSDDEKQTTDALMSFALALYYPYKNKINGEAEILVDL